MNSSSENETHLQIDRNKKYSLKNILIMLQWKCDDVSFTSQVVMKLPRNIFNR